MREQLFVIVLLVGLFMVACGGGEAPATSDAGGAGGSSEAAGVVMASDPEIALEKAAAEIEAAAEDIDELLGDRVTYTIDAEQSEVRFELDEVLRGSPITVVGIGNDLSGSITLDLANPAAAVISPILINPAALFTDQNMRNGAINRFILQSGTYDEIIFQPTALEGLPETAAVGDTAEFQIIGDLTIRDITQQVTFLAAVTVVDANTLAGSAETVIQRADFGLEIPSVPSVANVEEEVELYLDFVAVN